MTIGEKRDKVAEYCSKMVCSECLLKRDDWNAWIAHYTDDHCLDIPKAPETDLDRALALIEGKADVKADEPKDPPSGFKPLEAKPDPEKLAADDPVNHPSHYTSGGIECIDAIAASMTPVEYAGFLKGQVEKYVWRYRLKSKPVEDLKKARYYLERLIRFYEKEGVVE